MKDIKIIYMGTPEFAVAPLRALVENNYNIVAVITAPDKPAGRGKKIHQSAVKTYALSQNLPLLQPPNLKDSYFLDILSDLKADLQIVVAFRMLPQKVWAMPKKGTFNLHASLLPQYRGAAPIHRAIMNGEIKTGVTTFFLKQEIDTGNILFQEEVDITENMTTGELHDILMDKGTNLILKTVDGIVQNTIKETPQTHTDKLKLAPKIFKEDCKIDWNQPLDKIHNHIRGLNPYPIAWTTLNGKILKVFIGEKERIAHNESVANILTDQKSFLKVVTIDGYYNIKELQLEGKKRMSVKHFLSGYHENLTGVV